MAGVPVYVSCVTWMITRSSVWVVGRLDAVWLEPLAGRHSTGG
jgi:hypothetical protein